MLATLLAALPALSSAAAPVSPPPIVRTTTVKQIARGVWVVPDDRLVQLVPNVGIVEGTKAILVIDTGLGPANGSAVYRLASRIARGRHIILTTTHLHPEHALGASAFPDRDYIASAAQAAESREKLQGLGALFATFGPDVRRALAGYHVVLPTRTYRGQTRIDLGGRVVILREMPAHTRGDQIVVVPDASLMFTGDLVEEASFLVLFDADSRGGQWIAILKTLIAMHPRILVPGHGHVGKVRLIEPELAYLQRAQAMIAAASRAGETQSAATARLGPILGAMHPDWQFRDLIPYEIAIFYAETNGKPARMPPSRQSGQAEP